MTLKEQYWKDGYIFQFREGDWRMVCGDRLINTHGYIHINAMSADLHFIHSTLDDYVVAIYKPNYDVGCLQDFIKGKELVWKKSEYMMTVEEIKEKLEIPDGVELIIIKDKN